MNPAPFTLPEGVVAASIAGSFGALALVSLAIGWQLLRRVLLDRRQRRREAEARRDLAGLMGALFSLGATAPEQVQAEVRRTPLEIIANVLRSVRGVERDALLAAVLATGRIAPLLRALDSGGMVRRLNALRQLEAFDCPVVADALLRLLERPGAQLIRNQAALVLARQGVAVPAPLLISALRLERVQPALFHQALFREIALRDAREVFELITALRSVGVRAALIRALGHDVTLQAVPALEAWAAHPEPALRIAATMAAARLRHPGSLPWIRALFTDPAPRVRLAAVIAFRQIAPTAEAHELAAFTAETDPAVFGAAAEAAMAMRRGMAPPRLIEVGT
ncbi:MAG: HEAT repeat domain-containing protein [Proteobacteria bacterium]|nr:HEAT repeat domain-containing protein [Pseudomonadota bacterium]